MFDREIICPFICKWMATGNCKGRNKLNLHSLLPGTVDGLKCRPKKVNILF